MTTKPRIEELPEKKLVGISIRMSWADNKAAELWRRFMPRKNEIKNTLGTDLYSLQIFDRMPDFLNFDPHTSFTRWAAVETTSFEDTPEGMETHVLREGLYAVFLYKGLPQNVGPTIQFIYGEWLPASQYILDHRVHFELLGNRYKNNHPDSEEELWVPIRTKTKGSAVR